LLLGVLALAGCGSQHSAGPASGSHASQPIAAVGDASPLPAAHPQAIEPAAGVDAASGASAPAAVGVGVGVSSGAALAQPVSDTVIRRELAASGIAPSANQATLAPDGLAVAPIGAPLAVQEIIQAGNKIAKLPYRWGGGHGTYVDTGYDCSGSISYVFAAAGLLKSTLVSGQLMNYGDRGPGKWITIFANAGHTFMYIAGLRFDTVALAETGSRWSTRSADESNLSSFAIRHPPGL
jgi:cell wall-associated NlpC family hydrolase